MISTAASSCPHCGRPLTQIEEVIEAEVVESEPAQTPQAVRSGNSLRLVVAALILGALLALLARRLPLVVLLGGAALVVLWMARTSRR